MLKVNVNYTNGTCTTCDFYGPVEAYNFARLLAKMDWVNSTAIKDGYYIIAAYDKKGAV